MESMTIEWMCGLLDLYWREWYMRDYLDFQENAVFGRKWWNWSNLEDDEIVGGQI